MILVWDLEVGSRNIWETANRLKEQRRVQPLIITLNGELEGKAAGPLFLPSFFFATEFTDDLPTIRRRWSHKKKKTSQIKASGSKLGRAANICGRSWNSFDWFKKSPINTERLGNDAPLPTPIGQDVTYIQAPESLLKT